MRIALLLSVVLALAACGFEPLHGEKMTGPGDATRALLPIELAPVNAGEKRLAQRFRIAMEDLIDPAQRKAAQPYLLTTGIEYVRVPLLVRPDGAIGRYSLNLTVRYGLIRNTDQVQLTSGILRYVNGYDVLASDFSEYVSNEDALRRGVEQLAEDLRLRIAGYLARQPEGGKTPSKVTPSGKAPLPATLAPPDTTLGEPLLDPTRDVGGSVKF